MVLPSTKEYKVNGFLFYNITANQHGLYWDRLNRICVVNIKKTHKCVKDCVRKCFPGIVIQYIKRTSWPVVLHDWVVVIRSSLVQSGDLVKGIFIALGKKKKPIKTISGGLIQFCKKLSHIYTSIILVVYVHQNLMTNFSVDCCQCRIVIVNM